MLTIAHGGGALRAEAYTNSFEAMDLSYARGFRVFELDFKRTADGFVACRHDWGSFGGEAPTLGELRERFAGRFTPVDAEGLSAWMARRPDATLVTDVKEADQLPILRDLLAAGLPADRVIVQLFDPSEDDPVRRLGFARRSIILYRYRGSLHRLRSFIREAGPLAVGISLAQARAGLQRRLPAAPVWVYTVNAPGTARHLRSMGVAGAFSDALAPGAAGLTARAERPAVGATPR